MNKAILMSIQPAWLAKILNGEKTIAIRKTMPKCELPIDVYLYCTKDGMKNHLYHNDIWTLTNKSIYHYPYKNICGKVVAKFTLNNVFEYKHLDNSYDFYAWHIDNLVIFDKPKELSEFYKIKYRTEFEERYTKINKAPQSWQYVYVKGEQK